jgi:hypothetical protein
VTKLLLSVHVLAAIIAIGPVTVAASMFPAAARRVRAESADQRGVAVLRNLHRICRVYATLGVLVPVFGLATASSLGVLGDAWLIISMVLTAAAAAVLAFQILPRQTAILSAAAGAGPPSPAPASLAPAGINPAGVNPAAVNPAGVNPAGVNPAGVNPASRAPASLNPTGPASAGPNPASPNPASPNPAPAEDSGSPDGAILNPRWAARLGMVTGIFNLLWAVVVVLMIVRPGSTTGA